MNSLRLLYIFTISGSLNSANIWPWFNIFYKDRDFDVTYLISDCEESIKTRFFSEFPDCRIIFFKGKEILLNLSYIKRILYVKDIAKRIDDFAPDIIHIHGCYNTYLVLPLLFSRSKFRLIYNVWGNDFNTFYFKDLKHRIIINNLIKNSVLVWCNWYEMTDKLKSAFPKHMQKIRTIPWGIEADILSRPSRNIKTKVREKFQLNPSTYVMLYAKGLTSSNNQINLIKSLLCLNKNIDFKLIIHSPTSKDNSIFCQLKDFVDKNLLDSKVIFSNEYLTNDQIKSLFEIADLSFALSSQDQLTRTIFETIFADTNLIVSDIKPYRYLHDMLGINLDFVNPIYPKEIARKISYYINNKIKPNWEEEKKIITTKYNFDKRKDVFVKVYKSLLSE